MLDSQTHSSCHQSLFNISQFPEHFVVYFVLPVIDAHTTQDDCCLHNYG